MTDDKVELARQVFHAASEMEAQELAQALDYLASMVTQTDAIVAAVASDILRDARTDEDAEIVIALMKARKKMTTIREVLKQLRGENSTR